MRATVMGSGRHGGTNATRRMRLILVLTTLGVLGLVVWAGLSLSPAFHSWVAAGAERPARASAASAAAPKVPAAPILYFVHLGDIWKYDDLSGQAAVAVPAEGRAIGHPSWSLDGAALAWEEREVASGQVLSRILFRSLSGGPAGEQLSWSLDDASSPAVSPDGRYVLYQTADDGKSSLHVVDSSGQPVLSIADARDGSWASGGSGSLAALGTGLRIAFDRDGAMPSPNPGFYVHDVDGGKESLVPVRNALAPQAGPDGATYLLTTYSDGGNRGQIARLVGTTVESLVDVSGNESFDYRWLRDQQGGDVPCVELVPMGGGRSDIYRVNDDGDGLSPELSLLSSSFGWNSSLPSVSPFSDVGRDDRYYSAAVLLWANHVAGGYADRTFRPTDLLARAQFAKMLAGAVGIPVYEGLPVVGFIDLGEDVASLYPREYVSAAYYEGFVRGYPGGLFRPWGQVSRMQAVTMVVRAAGVYLPGGLAPVPEGWAGTVNTFSDPDHGDNLRLAEYNGLLAGIDLSDWDATAPATRGEAAQLLANLMHRRGPLYASATLTGVSGLSARSSSGAAPPVPSKGPIGKIVFDGDSLTAGSMATDPYPSQVMRMFRPEVWWVNLGIGGQRLADMLSHAPANVDPLYDASVGQNVVVVWAGTNDIRHWGHAPEVVYARLKEYCLGRRQMGFTVIVLTLLPRSDGPYPPTFERDRQILNSEIRATWPGFADAIVDVGSDQLIGQQGSELDLRFFSPDRVHLNNAGLSVVAGRVDEVLQRIDAAAAQPAS